MFTANHCQDPHSPYPLALENGRRDPHSPKFPANQCWLVLFGNFLALTTCNLVLTFVYFNRKHNKAFNPKWAGLFGGSRSRGGVESRRP